MTRIKSDGIHGIRAIGQTIMSGLRDTTLGTLHQHLDGQAGGDAAVVLAGALRKLSDDEKKSLLTVFAVSLDIGISQLVYALDTAGGDLEGLEVRFKKVPRSSGDFALGDALPRWKEKISHYDDYGRKKPA